MISPSVMMTITACEPRMVEKFDQVRKLSGRNAPKTAMVAAQTSTSANRSSQSARFRLLSLFADRSDVLLADTEVRPRSSATVASFSDRRLADPIARELAHHDATAEHQDAITDRSELFIIRACAEHRRPLLGHFANRREYLSTGANVDSLRRFVKQHQTR